MKCNSCTNTAATLCMSKISVLHLQSVNKKAVKVCKLLENGSLKGCKAAKYKKKKFRRSMGKVTASTAGKYV